MSHRSILLQRADDDTKKETVDEPAFFTDLNLDQIIAAITSGKEEYNLKPFFHTSLSEIDAITYRHEIMRDLQNTTPLQYVKSFAQRMRDMREHLTQANKMYYKYQKESWFLDAVGIYCEAVNCLAHDLASTDLISRGLSAFREYLINYTQSDRFASLVAETDELKADLATVKYCLLIKSGRIKVRKYDSELDYNTEVQKTFEKFAKGTVKDYGVTFADPPEMNHIEAGVLDLVARLYPEIFSTLDNFYVKNSSYLDDTIKTFDREVQFYIAYLDYMAIFQQVGLHFCYPNISNECKAVHDRDGFDLALARKLVGSTSSLVCNDFYLKDNERILVVSGPNQGGKTTFAVPLDSCTIWPASAAPFPARKRNSSCSIGSLPISKGKRTSKICAANCRTISSGFPMFSTRLRRTASS